MKILVPIDGSRKSLQALRYALNFAEKIDSQVVVLNVQIESDVTIVEPISWDAPVLKERAEKVFSLAKKELEGSKVNVEYKMLQGNPAREIIKYADDQKFDLVVIGAHGLSGIKEFLLGSVANKVSRHSMVPTLIVK